MNNEMSCPVYGQYIDISNIYNDGYKQGQADLKKEYKDLIKGFISGIRKDAIDECISKIDTLEQISFGIVEVDLIKSLLKQLKEQE